MKLLIVGDASESVKSLAVYLRSENYVCEEVDPRSARQKTDRFGYDCIILDVNDPDEADGFVLLQGLRESGWNNGVMVMSDRGIINRHVVDLDLWADDYMAKPIHFRELNDRLAAVIRRRVFNGQPVYILNELEVDLVAKTVLVNSVAVDLTRTEYDLLLFLIAKNKLVVSKNAIAEHLLGDNTGEQGSYDFIYSHMKNLKKKLEQAGCRNYIKTVYGAGYKFGV